MFNKKIFEKVARDSTLNQRIQMKMYNWRDSGCEYNTDMIQIVYDIIDEVRIFDEENEQDSILGLIEMQTRKLSEDLEMKGYNPETHELDIETRFVDGGWKIEGVAKLKQTCPCCDSIFTGNKKQKPTYRLCYGCGESWQELDIHEVGGNITI